MKKLLLALILFKISAIAFAQAPSITYNGPQVYVTGKAITNLSPVNSGGAVPATVFGLVTTVAGTGASGAINGAAAGATFFQPFGTTLDSQGNIYVSDFGNNLIRKITPSGIVSTFVSSGLLNPAGLAVDAGDNLYIADAGNNQIKKVTPAGVVSIYAGSGDFGADNGAAALSSFKSPEGVAVDQAGNVYVSDYGNQQIRKITTGGIVSPLAGNTNQGLVNGPFPTARFKFPFGIATDAAGNIYVADSQNHAIRKVTPTGVVTTLAGNGISGYADGNGSAARFASPTSVTVDANGFIYVADSGNSLIRRISPNGDVTTVAGNLGSFGKQDGIGTDALLSYPTGLVTDNAGNVYISDNSSNTIRKVVVYGYGISAALPPGLSFNGATGVISGTPTDVTAAAVYKITAYNALGSSSANVTISVRDPSADATLSTLTISSGTLAPAFASSKKNYAVSVPNSTTSITVTPALSDANAILKVNGVAQASGLASPSIPLNAGGNAIAIQVIAEDGTTIENYQVTVLRASPAVAKPVISYATPQVYTVGTAIPNLVPAQNGGAVPASRFGEVTTYAIGFNNPSGVAADAQGNVFVSDHAQVTKIAPGGAKTIVAAPPGGYNAPWSLGTDILGNLYVANTGNNNIQKVTPAGVVTNYAGTGNYDFVNGSSDIASFKTPISTATDAQGNVYVADADNNVIRKISINGDVTTYAGTGAAGSTNGSAASATFSAPFGVTSDAQGNVYVIDKDNRKVRLISAAGIVSTFAGSGAAGSINANGTAATFDKSFGITMDALGNLYVADSNNSMIRKITPAGDVTLLAGNGNYAFDNGIGESATFSFPTGIAADNTGHLFVADFINNAVRKIDITGYEINPALPAGLSFDATTGVISGTPTAISAAQGYKVTAYNLGGSSITFVTITVKAITNNANLSALLPSTGTLAPVFAANTISYNISVPAATTSITLTPTVSAVGATVTVNGVAVNSGSPSAGIPLNVGPNVISTVVTATDGTTTKTYTVTVTRAVPVLSSDANLAALALASGTLSPTFAQTTTSYTATVPNATSSITITPTYNESHATIKVNGTTVTSGAASTAIPLAVGANTVTTLVTAENGTTTKTYTVTITRSASANADLSNLTLSDGTLSPVFAAGTLTYTAGVSNTTSAITLTPFASDATATIKVNGVTVASGAASASIPLAVGANIITTVVTAQDGTTIKTYTVTVTRATSSNADLASLGLSSGTLNPSFAAATTGYTASVANATTSIQVTPASAEPNATIKVNGTALTSGTASAAIPLVVGSNPITVAVTAQDGTTIKTYTIDVNRGSSVNADLAGFAISAGTLSPAFAATTTGYATSVNNATTGISITPTLADASATVKVNGVLVTSGSASAVMPLVVGTNTITTDVAAQDGSTVKTYTLTVTRAASANADLANLSLSSGILNPTFAAATTAYTASVANATTSIQISPTFADPDATITVNGTAVTSGSASLPVSLVVGTNTINTTVTAQDGTTIKTYTVTVTRAPSVDADLAGLTISAGSLNPAFVSGTTAYTTSVSNAVNSITVTPTSSESNAVVTVNGTAVASGSASAALPLVVGTNTIATAVTAQDGTTIKTYTLTVTRAASSNADLANIVLSSGTLTPTFDATTTSYSALVGNAVTSITLTPTSSDPPATIKVNGTTVTSGSASSALPLVVGANIITTTVTAQDGTTIKTYTINVTRLSSSNADLADLTISTGTLTPTFAAGTTTYTASVGNTVTDITLTPTAADVNSVIKVNGTTVASGSASAALPLVVGANTITTAVTAQDGTTKNYTVTVTRAASSNADLANLTISSGTLTPAFAPATTGYTASVGNAVTSITLTPTIADATATIQVNGTTVASGTASSALPLVVGANTITTLVTAQDGTQKTYTVTVTRAAATNANLASLTITPGTLAPAFVSTTTGYTASVANATTSVTVTPTSADANATINVNGTAVGSGSTSGALPLVVGANTITTSVTAQDGTTIKTYIITVTRAASSNADLTDLTISSGTLTPTFDATTTSYSALVGNAVTSITLTPTSSDPTATIKVNGTAVAGSSASGALPLVVGTNTITTTVTAQDGTTIKTYTVTVTRAPSSNADLANIVLSTGTLTPTFAAATVDYTASVANATTSITLTPTFADATATIKVNGVTVASGSASAALPLVVGANTITTSVTAQDGTTKTYTVTVSRAASSNADLANLTISSGALTPAFAPTTTGYTAAVGNTVTSITLTPTFADATATIQVNGVTLASGTASSALPLVVGANTITTLVTAQDGTQKTYTVTVTRAQSANADLTALTISSGTLSPAFASSITTYNVSVGNLVTSVNLTPTVSDAAATVTVNNGTVTSGTPSADLSLNVGANAITTVVTAENGTTKTYTVTVTRAPSANANLADLVLSSGTLNPAFAQATTSFTASVANSVTSVTVTPTFAELNAIIKVNGTAVASGSPSAGVSLIVGSNTITTTVTAQDGTTIKTYTVTITRAPSSNADLANIVLSTGTLTPNFAAATVNYTASVANATSSITLTPTFADATATIKVNGASVASGTPSASIPLIVGFNVITINVTAQDGTTVKTYTVTVKRAPSTNANLSNLTISDPGGLSPSFSKNNLGYSKFVPNSTLTFSLTPTLEDNTATIKINGVTVANGASSVPATLTVGNNFFNIVVTAQDGTTTKTYTVVINRLLSSANDLSNLKISTGTLTPGFQSGINNYTASVGNAVTSTIITPTVADITASVKVNGVAVASGSPSGPINLVVGANTINTVVTAQNGVTNTYVIVVTRAPSANAALANLVLSSGTLNPGFTASTASYSASVPNAVNSINITPTASDATAKITVNGSAVASGSASANLPLVVGANSITTVVTAQDGTTKLTYVVTVTRAPSSDATLGTFVLSAGTLTPAFTSGTVNYTAVIPNLNTAITVTPAASEPNATITVNGVTVTSGSASASIPLNVGPNTIVTKVTAQDGTVKTYTVIATREASSNADLANIVLSNGAALTPAFSPATVSYTAPVANSITGITLTPTISDATATVKVNGNSVISGAASANIPLAVGPNVITTVVTAQNGTTKTYTVTVNRAPSPNADLSNLTANNGTLQPAFAPGVISYIINVGNNVGAIRFRPTTSDIDAAVQVQGEPVNSGDESSDIALTVGDNNIAVVVTAANGLTKTYTIVVNRAPSSNASLINLRLSAGTLSPTFATGTISYTATVSSTTNNIRITPTLSDATATVKVNGVNVNSGSASADIALNVGPNTIITTVIAADGTDQTYTVVVTREVSHDATLYDLTLSSGFVNPSFSSGTRAYTVLVKTDVSSINLTAFTTDPNATLTINGIAVTSGSASGNIALVDGVNDIAIVVTAQDGTTRKTYSVSVTRAALAMVLPSAFTPNNDGYNDTWKLNNLQFLYPDCTVKVFNRAGQMMFSSVGYGTDWDGTFQGKQLPADVYYYIIDLKHNQGVKSGSVTIIR